MVILIIHRDVIDKSKDREVDCTSYELCMSYCSNVGAKQDLGTVEL